MVAEYIIKFMPQLIIIVSALGAFYASHRVLSYRMRRIEDDFSSCVFKHEGELDKIKGGIVFKDTFQEVITDVRHRLERIERKIDKMNNGR